MYGSRHSTSSSKGSDSSRQPFVYSSRVSREDLAPKDYRSRGSSLGRVYSSEQPVSTIEAAGSKPLHQKNAQDSSNLRFSSSSNDILSYKPPSSSFLSSRSHGSAPPTVADRDRSRPDGEVSEQVHTDKYRPGVRSSYESLKQERSTKNSTNESNRHKSGSYSFSKDHSSVPSKDSYGGYRREDTYLAYLSDSKLDRQPSQPKSSPTGNSLGSKGERFAFFNITCRDIKLVITSIFCCFFNLFLVILPWLQKFCCFFYFCFTVLMHWLFFPLSTFSFPRADSEDSITNEYLMLILIFRLTQKV